MKTEVFIPKGEIVSKAIGQIVKHIQKRPKEFIVNDPIIGKTDILNVALKSYKITIEEL